MGGRVKGGNILEQNPFNWLDMAQFEFPKVGNPCVSFTYGEFPFPLFCPWLLLSLCSLQYKEIGYYGTDAW